jgi:hypothetical protein
MYGSRLKIGPTSALTSSERATKVKAAQTKRLKPVTKKLAGAGLEARTSAIGKVIGVSPTGTAAAKTSRATKVKTALTKRLKPLTSKLSGVGLEATTTKGKVTGIQPTGTPTSSERAAKVKAARAKRLKPVTSKLAGVGLKATYTSALRNALRR